MRPECTVEGCHRSVHGRGLCDMHYLRMLRRGDVGGPSPEKYHGPPEVRFWIYVDRIGDEECWNWTGGTSNRGYGSFGVSKSLRVGAHRFAYEILVGPIPEGLHLDHLCRNVRCCNPAHMEPVTIAENNRRAKAAREACIHGHPWRPETTRYRKNGTRVCKPCAQAEQALQYQRRKALGLYDKK